MGAIDRVKSLLGWAAPVYSGGSVTVTRRSGSTDAPGADTVSGASALALSSVWACVNLVAGTTASLPFQVYRPDGAVRTVDKSHRLYRLLHDSPNYDQTALDFWEYMAASLELWGNAYAAIERGFQDEIVALRPVPPQAMVVRRAENRALEYRWPDSMGNEQVREDFGVLHIRGFGGDPLGGMSTLQFARSAFAAASAVDRAAATTFRNSLRPSGVLTFDKWLTSEQRDIAENALAEKFIGAHHAGRPLILEGDTKWQPLTINPEDAQMLETRRFSVEEICRWFGVPPHMIGHTENSTSWGTGLESQTLGFQKFNLRRRLKRIEQAVQKQLLSPADRAAGVSVGFNLEGLLRADSAGRSAFYSTMVAMGAMTVNEVRALENLPPVPGGDVPRVQMQNIPLNETQEPDV